MKKKYYWVAGIVIIIILGYYLVKWWITPDDYSKCGECRARIIDWCMNCKISNWVDGPKLDECTAWCGSTYFSTGWTTDNDCNVSNAKEFCKQFIVE